ncbi:MAG: putative membrane-bound dehydrogenase-like protein [Akkermansiaceae bacterium]|jgi:putative membrane-bound dehydrogenase-like protein
MMKFALLTLLGTVFLPEAHGQSPKQTRVKDAKTIELKKAAPPRDPKLASFSITLKTSPRAAKAEPVETTLPLKLKKGDRICLIGNLLLDAERRYGHLETLIHQHHPEHELTVRNLAWPADEIDLMPRPDNFGDLDQHLTYFQADVIIAAYGFNESFAGEAGLPDFKVRLDKFLTELKSKAYNGESAPRIVLVTPVPEEYRREVPFPKSDAPSRENANVSLYSSAMKKVALKQKVACADVFYTGGLPVTINRTIDGHALSESGHAEFAERATFLLFGNKVSRVNEPLRKLVVDKATQFFYRYRPLNTFYYTGGRNKSYGYLDFLPAMRNFDLMVENRDKAIHATVSTGKLTESDDSNLPVLDDVVMARGANEFLSPANEQKAFKVDPRFEVNCFASEEDFPEMACPIAMRWDNRGRLWVSTSVTYPHVYPGQKPRDKIIILEDTDQDGKADKCTTWADDLHIPLSFVLDGSGGVYCSEQPHLTHLTDQDGDGKMDHREIVWTGFGCEDSHHSLHDFTWTPGGDLMFRESIFHHSQIETVYGPVRTQNSSWFLYKPQTRKLIAFGSYPNTNPWGVTFDKWGNHVASHPVFASTFHATNPAFPRDHRVGNGFQQESGQHPHAKGMQAYSGTCGHGFVTHDFWPEEMQGGFIKARYKPTNKIEFHKWIEKEDHFAEEFQFDLIFSTNLSFIPVDLNFGPEGACYICDWYNPVKGHAQYSLRDPRRDRKAGRIWRIVPKGAKLAEPPKIAGALVPDLISLLKSPHLRTRELTKLEIRNRKYEAGVTTTMPLQLVLDLAHETEESINLFQKLEVVRVRQSFGSSDPEMLESLIYSEDHLIAAAALKLLRFSSVSSRGDFEKFLNYGASHSSQHVRREAAICASYLGLNSKDPRILLKAIYPVLDQPAGVHLSYAIRSAFMSDALKPHWPSGTAEKLAKLSKNVPFGAEKLTKAEKKFDRQKGLQMIKIGTISERLLYSKDKFTVKAGKPVKLIFNNPDATEHNLLILDEGASVEEIGMAANEMAKSPAGAKKNYIPEDERVLHATRLIKTGRSQTLRFVAPTKPGEYPFVCTFPGHWTIMRGVMTVE